MNESNTPRTDPLAPPVAPTPQGGRKAPVPKQKRPGPYRVPLRSSRTGLIIVNTGDGKGKTTAALGLLLRATGRGMRAGMWQFVKRIDDGGEHRMAQKLGVEIIPMGDGCTLGREDLTDSAELARLGWARCEALLIAGDYDLLILDELTLPLAWGWLDVADVIHTLKRRAPGTHVVITGRHAPAALIEAADLVTDMRMIKHPLQEQGVSAQAGIDV